MYSDMEKIPCKLYPRLLGDLSKMYLGLDALGAGASQLYIGVVVLGPPYSFYSRSSDENSVSVHLSVRLSVRPSLA